MTTTLVIGGTGTSGRRVAQRLRAQGVDVRVGSRSSATRFDWHDDATWVPALRGASAAYLTYTRTSAIRTLRGRSPRSRPVRA